MVSIFLCKMIEICINSEKKKYRIDIDIRLLQKNIEKYYKRKLSTYTQVYQEIYLNYNLVSKKSQRKINYNYLNHNYNTDIITFELSKSNNIINGDIYINPKKVTSNAIRYKTSYYQEIHRVFIHGFLHLLGFNDKTKQETKIMRKEEDKFLKYIVKQNVPRGTNK